MKVSEKELEDALNNHFVMVTKGYISGSLYAVHKAVNSLIKEKQPKKKKKIRWYKYAVKFRDSRKRTRHINAKSKGHCEDKLGIDVMIAGGYTIKKVEEIFINSKKS